MTAAVHYLVETHLRLYTERGFLCGQGHIGVQGDPTFDLAGPTTRDPSAVTCPECLRRLADQTAERLRGVELPDWLRHTARHDFSRMLGETDESFRARVAAITRRTP